LIIKFLNYRIIDLEISSKYVADVLAQDIRIVINTAE